MKTKIMFTVIALASLVGCDAKVPEKVKDALCGLDSQPESRAIICSTAAQLSEKYPELDKVSQLCKGAADTAEIQKKLCE